MKKFLLAACLFGAPMVAQARPVLVELYTSQSCSSCPPANALMQQLAAQDKGILVLALNVTYWNDLGWHDTDSLDSATARQYWYAMLSSGQNVYTPEAVVDGKAQIVGSDRAAVTQAIAAAKASAGPGVPLSVGGGAMVKLGIGAGTGNAEVLMLGYDAHHATHVGGGENGGVLITETNVVRSLTDLGPWLGAEEHFALPRPAGEHVALLLQAKDGSVLGLASQ